MCTETEFGFFSYVAVPCAWIVLILIDCMFALITSINLRRIVLRIDNVDAQTLDGRSDRSMDTAGHDDMTSTDRHESETVHHTGQTDGSETPQQQQQQEAADNNERRRRTAVFVHGPVLTVRDRVFHALFYRLALIYARVVPHQLRRVVEFALLFEVH